MKQHQHSIVVVAGPTAVGKTEVALALATLWNAPVISFDSRQCYRELNIGVARPEAAQLARAPHYFIADHSIHDPINAAYYAQFAQRLLSELFTRHERVIMVGGTGLYWRSFWQGLDAIPAIDPAVREQIIRTYEEKGKEWLTLQLQQKDPLFARHGEMQNPQRMMRALEVVTATGQSILSFQKNEARALPYKAVGIGLSLPRPLLVDRIHARVDQMIEQGLINEVESLWDHRSLAALRTVGYSELFSWMEGDLTRERAIEQIKTNTRQYAKRQMTWFGRDPFFQWFAPDQLSAISSVIDR